MFTAEVEIGLWEYNHISRSVRVTFNYTRARLDESAIAYGMWGRTKVEILTPRPPERRELQKLPSETGSRGYKKTLVADGRCT